MLRLGTDICPHCDREVDYVLDPSDKPVIKCPNSDCGKDIVTCDCCEGSTGNGSRCVGCEGGSNFHLYPVVEE